jgi:hypothetical protein
MAPHSDESVYRKPPQEILDILDAPPEPSITLSPCREKVRAPPTLALAHSVRAPGCTAHSADWLGREDVVAVCGWPQLLMLHRPPPLPPVAELARPELKLAGARSFTAPSIDPTPPLRPPTPASPSLLLLHCCCAHRPW